MGGNWSPVSSGTQRHEYIRADLAPTPGWRDIASAPKVKPLDISDAVAVCPICDIAGCHHLRAAKAALAHPAIADRLQALAEETRKALNGISASDADVFEAAARILAALAAPGEPQ